MIDPQSFEALVRKVEAMEKVLIAKGLAGAEELSPPPPEMALLDRLIKARIENMEKRSNEGKG